MPDVLDAFAYDLPAELIAQEPPAVRGSSRLLVLERGSGRVEHRQFPEIVDLLRPGDLLVVNETRVFPARLRARRPTGRQVEVLLLEAVSATAWEALARPAKHLHVGETLAIESGGALAAVELHPLGRAGERVVVELRRGGAALGQEDILAFCEAAGETPLPPYIHRPPERRRSIVDRERYQTVFARTPGAVAAPTAGLHFTPEILAAARDRGVDVARLTLHVGLGTFQPLAAEALERSTLHAESVEVPEATAAAVRDARRAGRRIVAVGTTTARALESFAGRGEPGRWRTELFIKPGHIFLAVDALVTNFHLPRSSLLVLASAFAGRERLLGAYHEAIRERYRFYSYGDAMLIV